MKAEKINEFIDSFEPMYKNGESNDPNDDDMVTYYCDDGKDNVGFVENIKWIDGGLEKLICKKWILQSKLDELILQEA